MSLREMVRSGAPIHDIASWLDELDAQSRVAESVSLGRADQRALCDLAAASAPLTLADFVPASVGDRTEVIHEGRNTLPVFKRFQKRFCRPEGDDLRLMGYNEGFTRAIIGPGFFVAHPTHDDPAEWQERGAIVIDYFQVPDSNEQVVDGWPKVKPNSSGLQMFVYNRTRDFMRRVSTHVTIGAAYRVEKPLHSWFTLCRAD